MDFTEVLWKCEVRLGSEDHLVQWSKPASIRSLDRQTYRALPKSITVREARIRVTQPGFRTKSIVVVTTLLDPKKTTIEDLAALYRAVYARHTLETMERI